MHYRLLQTFLITWAVFR